MALPDNWLPEGIATVGGTAYLGSRADGDILRLDLSTGECEVFSRGPARHPGRRHEGPRTACSGWPAATAAPAASSTSASGRHVATFAFTHRARRFVNDVVLIGDAAWFTDSAASRSSTGCR